MNLIEQLGGYEKAKLIVNSALDFTHIDIYDGFEYFIYEKQNGNGNINDVLTFNPRLNHTGSAFVQGGLDKYGGWHISINEIKTALLEHRRQHNIYEIDDYVVYQGDAGLSGLFRIEKLTKTGKPKSVKSNRFGGFPCRYCEVRHATDAEIKAGKRL